MSILKLIMHNLINCIIFLASNIYKILSLSDTLLVPQNLPNDFIGILNGMIFQNLSLNTYNFDV